MRAWVIEYELIATGLATYNLSRVNCIFEFPKFSSQT